MLLNVKTTSISIAVTCFFIISFIGWFVQLEPLICCKRAIIGAVIAYVLTKYITNAINNIVIGALVKFRMKQQDQNANRNEN